MMLFLKPTEIKEELVPCTFADSKQITQHLYKLQHDLYALGSKGNFTVKKGFIHDGASKWIFRHFGKETNPAILHDALYQSEVLPRKEADEIFLCALKSVGISYARRYTYYWTVRAVGGLVWRKHTKESIKEARNFISKGINNEKY